MVAQYHGKSYSLEGLRRRAHINRDGVSLLSISDAAESIGLRTLGVKISFDQLAGECPLPCIAHWNQRHFVVVYKIKGKRVTIADPAVGLVTLTSHKFEKSWQKSRGDSSKVGIALLLETTPAFYKANGEESNDRLNGLALVIGYIGKYKGLLVQLALGLFAGSLIQLALPFLTQSIVDVGIQTHNIPFIYLVLIAQMSLFLGRMAVEFLRRWILLHLSTRVSISLISDFLARLFKLPLSYFESKMIGDILRRIEDHSRVERFISTSSLSVLFSLFNLVVYSLVLVIYDIPIFLVFCSLSVVYVVYVLLFMRKRAELDYKRFNALATNQSSLIQSVQGMVEIKMSNAEITRLWDWQKIQANLFKVNVKGVLFQQYQDAGSMFINESKNMIITVMAALAVIDGSITLGMMLAMQYIIGQLNAPVNDFIVFSRDWQDASISLQRISEIRQSDTEDEGLEVLPNILPKSKSIRVHGLSYQYGGPHSRKILDDVSFEIPEGRVTAIVGASGSGKTTLMKLLLKLYRPTEGFITVGGEKMHFINDRLWRSHCGSVMQDGHIFSDTIARNIALSTEETDWGRLREAAAISNIREFIETLPLAYFTRIGNGGVGLSQGQKQRLLIARAVYKNPDILMFDEATSALDTNNESEILENLRRFYTGKTVVIIAHRLSTVRNADVIVVLNKGRVAEIGTHEELVQSKGHYYSLISNQLDLGT
jgi:ATP-binding cassette subfamily B protein